MNVKALREEFAALQSEGLDLISKIETDKRDFSADEKTAHEARVARMETIKAQIDADAKFAQLALAEGRATLPTMPPGKAEYEAALHGAPVTADKLDRAEFGQAVTRWAGTGQLANKFATITTATASSILLPKTVVSPLVTGAANTIREAYAAWGLTPFATPGDTSTFNLPVIDPTAGGQVAENASSETENAPSFSQSIVSTVKTYESGSVYFSGLQLSATSFDLIAATVPGLVFNKEMGLESTIIAAMIADAGITQSVTTATPTGFTYVNSVKFANKLPKRYQALKVRLLSATAYEAAEALVDDNNRPVMVSDPQNQTLKKMHGVPTFRCDYLEALTADNIVGLEFSLVGFHLRDAGEGIARYDQVPARPNQIGVNLFGYHAYGYAPSAVVKFVTAAS